VDRREFLGIVAAALAAPLVEPALRAAPAPVEDSRIWLQPYMYFLEANTSIVTDRHFLLEQMASVVSKNSSLVRLAINGKAIFEGPAWVTAMRAPLTFPRAFSVEPNSKLELFSDDLDLRVALSGVRPFQSSELPPGEVDAEFVEDDDEEEWDR
jgi:hypothetical protein